MAELGLGLHHDSFFSRSGVVALPLRADFRAAMSVKSGLPSHVLGMSALPPALDVAAVGRESPLLTRLGHSGDEVYGRQAY